MDEVVELWAEDYINRRLKEEGYKPVKREKLTQILDILSEEMELGEKVER